MTFQSEQSRGSDVAGQDAATPAPELSPPPAPAPIAAPWTAPQRGVMLALTAGLLIYLGLRYLFNPLYIADPQPPTPARWDELADRIDPNTADWQMLAALPAVGEKRAKEIIAFREQSLLSTPGQPVFQKPEDLLQVYGIGEAMLESMEPYLLFPPADPTTQP